jgi:hypothetical protein
MCQRFAFLLLLISFSHYGLGQSNVTDMSADTSSAVDKVSANNVVRESEVLFEGRFDEGEELIFTMKVDKYSLGEIVAIAETSSVLLDFVAYTEFTEFPIAELPDTRIFSGWFRNPDNTFELNLQDLSAPFVTINKKRYALDPNEVKYVNDFLYVESSLISAWFEISHEYDFRSLDLELNPRQLLPFQERLNRANKGVSRFGVNLPQHPELARSYGILSPQVLDIQLNAAYRDNSNQLSTRYGIVGARDVAYLNANLFLAGSDIDVLSDSRLTFSKVSHTGELLGPLKATQFSFGDVQPIRQGLTRGRSRGFKFSNVDTTNTVDIEKINISGPLQIGWDVELYQNGVLIDQQSSVQSGEFSFLDVPVNIGNNEFKIMKYGPQGEVETETRTKVVDASLIDDQGFTYGVSLTESDKSLFNVRDVQFDTDVGYNLSSDMRKTFGGVSAGISLQTDFGGDIEQSSAGLTLNSVLADRIIWGLNYRQSTDNSFSSGLNLRSILYGQSINANVAISGSSDSTQDLSDTITSNLALAGNLAPVGFKSINYSASARHTDNGNETKTNISARMGYSAKLFSIFNNTDYNLIQDSIGEQESISGSITTQTYFSDVFARFSANYDLTDGFEINSYSGQINWAYSKLFKARLEGSYVTESKQYSTKLAVGTQTDRFTLFSDIGYSSNIGWTAGVNLNFSLSAQPLIYGDIYQTNNKLTQTGSVSVRVFIDANQNAKYEMGEVLLPNVQVSAVQAVRRAYSDELGIAKIMGLSDGLLTDIVVDRSTLPGGMLTPLVDGVSIRSRGGYADAIDFPVVTTTEIEGVVTYETNDEVLPIARSRVLLINQRGDVIKETNTEFDGYYVFEDVMSGIYRVSLAPDVLISKKLQTKAADWLSVITSDEEFYIEDINYQPLASVNGFVSKLAEFSSEDGLAIYLKLNRKKLSGIQGNLKHFDKDGKQILISKFNKSKNVIEAHCAEIVARGFRCESLPYTYWFK